MSDNNQRRVRIGFVFLWTFFGLLLLVLATVLVNGWKDATYWSSVLVGLGTTIFLAGFLVWLERRFVATTRKVARDAANSAASEAATLATEAATKSFSERLDTLQERVDQQREQRVRHQDSLVDALEEEISYERILEALLTATNMRAISSPLYVSAGAGVDAPVVGFELVRESPQVRFDDAPSGDITGVEISIDTSLLGTAWVVSTIWSPEDDPVAVLAALQNEMISVGYGPAARTLSFELLFSNLRTGLADAVSGRRGDRGSWRTSETLIDVLNNDWVISEAGVEHRERGVVVDRRQLAERFQPPRRFTPPQTPDWAVVEDWQWVIKRGRARIQDVMSFLGH